MLRIDTCITDDGVLPTTYVISESQKYCTVRPKEGFQSIIIGKVPDLLFAALEVAVAAQDVRVASELSIAAASWFVDKKTLTDLMVIHSLAYASETPVFYQRYANPEHADMLDMFNRRPQVLAKEMKHDATD